MEIHHFDQKMSCNVKTLDMVQTYATQKKNPPLSSIRGLMDYASLEVKQKKYIKKTNTDVRAVIQGITPENISSPSSSSADVLARHWLRTTGFSSVHINSIQFLAAEFKPQPFSVLKSCWGERGKQTQGESELVQKWHRRVSWAGCMFSGGRRWYTSLCQTELSFTNPLTESSCSESWLAGL